MNYKIHKKLMTIALAISLPFAVSAFPGGDQAGLGGPKHSEHRVARLTKQLALNAEQQSQLKLIFQEQQAKQAAIHQETQTRLQSVLTPEQWTQFEALKQRQHQQWQQKHEQRQQQKAARQAQQQAAPVAAPTASPLKHNAE